MRNLAARDIPEIGLPNATGKRQRQQRKWKMFSAMSTKSDVPPLMVCNVGWMSRYQGLDGKPDNIVGGGQYVRQHGKGHEVCNFLPCEDGNVYGHVETIKGDKDRQIKIDNILPESGNPGTDSVSGVDVLWVATNSASR
jgi:hypothetical protein